MVTRVLQYNQLLQAPTTTEKEKGPNCAKTENPEKSKIRQITANSSLSSQKLFSFMYCCQTKRPVAVVLL